ncbi:hypothetical protein CFIO01_11592 [Colletotrichum fioriniae PJ7]|uniref:Uncharacterized protein n=1 Tax=Colletotrichum fioriniae PJ7 TaxID=1445577 RepID=A0A010RDK7_9PEZI|nr:hypothetical protein CFIO01_11592 [Colletotrichum fioriniae PJ7]
MLLRPGDWLARAGAAELRLVICSDAADDAYFTSRFDDRREFDLYLILIPYLAGLTSSMHLPLTHASTANVQIFQAAAAALTGTCPSNPPPSQ